MTGVGSGGGLELGAELSAASTPKFAVAFASNDLQTRTPGGRDSVKAEKRIQAVETLFRMVQASVRQSVMRWISCRNGCNFCCGYANPDERWHAFGSDSFHFPCADMARSGLPRLACTVASAEAPKDIMPTNKARV